MKTNKKKFFLYFFFAFKPVKGLMVLTQIYMVLHNSHNSSVVHRPEASKIVLWGHRPGHTWTNSHLSFPTPVTGLWLVRAWLPGAELF